MMAFTARMLLQGEIRRYFLENHNLPRTLIYLYHHASSELQNQAVFVSEREVFDFLGDLIKNEWLVVVDQDQLNIWVQWGEK